MTCGAKSSGREKWMKVKDIIRNKGSTVHSVPETAIAHDVARLLRDLNIGAIVVTTGDGDFLGLVNQRDLVRAMANRGGSTRRRCCR